MALANIDYREIINNLIGTTLKDGDEQYQYSIERRNGVLQIVELNFKPNTKGAMALPLPVYNEFVEALVKYMPKDGVKASKTNPIFRNIYEKYRRDYLGATKPLAPSSYLRYNSVLCLLWRVTEGKLGFKAQLTQQHQLNTVEQKGDELHIISTTETRGYFIKPTGNVALQIIDRDQKALLDFA